MARKGDGIYKRGKAWRLDFTHNGQRHTISLGRNIKRGAAVDIAAAQRAAILKGELGIGRKRRDIGFDDAKNIFLEWVKANKRPKTYRSYSQCLGQMEKSLRGKKLSEIHPFLIEKHKQKRVLEGARVAINREITCLKTLYNRCIDWKKYEGENPARKVKKLEEAEGQAAVPERGRRSSAFSRSKGTASLHYSRRNLYGASNPRRSADAPVGKR